MEAFSCLMDKAVVGDYMEGFLVANHNRSALMVSHLLFVDDTLIFVAQREINYFT